ncbi:hypothetical protein MNBD_GAMMA12-2397 [hydrothermal vent metagenome]|uniref:Uncharacterized protein n=1 Tax=hydrothermal vent metagenome TaxID=652676 RepID=A0A3B0YIM4_9ZZZZ
MAKKKSKKKVVKKSVVRKTTVKKTTAKKKISARVSSKSKVDKANKKTVEVLLQSLQVKENSIGSGLAFGLIKFAWKYPKPGKAVIEAVVPFMGLGDGDTGRIDFTSNPYSLADEFLFKYQPQGRSVIRAEVAITKRPGLVSKIISSVLSKGITLVANPLVGLSLNMLLDAAGLTKEKIRVIGQTSFEIPDEPETGLVDGQLVIPQAFNVYRQAKFSNEWDDDEVEDFEDSTFSVGDDNGILTIKTIQY